ncbi:M20 family metallopeptidase [Amycolatopsis jejuensis]|uniref:M20 family metallopeptidase n=1 Tax=Amycolatopsis jejuensis TaxID=330084 RepID=UPI0005257990|nr:M20 family metallopeptidase [Amycolatopsis jejuensis]
MTDVAGAVDERRVTELTSRLIQCDTRNPPGGEQPVVEPLVAVMRELGAEIEIFEPVLGRPSVLATVGRGDGPTLLVNGHIDTVPVTEADWSVPPFGGEVRGDRLYGRGACDMKGGIAAAIEGLRACRDAGIEPPSTLAFHFVADEETGSQAGTQALVASGRVRADAAVVPEPSDLQVCVAERGALLVELTVHGKAAHGSDPAVGRSAVADAARIVTALHLADFGAQHPLLGSPTCNAGTIEGGVSANVVAASCRIRLDRRVLPGQSAEEALKSLFELVDAVGDFHIEADVLAFAEGSQIEADHPFVSQVREAADSAPIRGLYLGTDARFLRNQLGIPAVVYGPGSMKVAHAADEYVVVADLATAARTFARLYANFRGGS